MGGAPVGWTQTLGQDLGRYPFRPCGFELHAKNFELHGENTVMADAINTVGQTQTATLIRNPVRRRRKAIADYLAKNYGTQATAISAVAARAAGTCR